MKDGLGTAVQLAGFVCLIVAAFLIAVPLGLVALGLVLIPAGHVLDGFDWRKQTAKVRRARQAKRIRRAS